MNDFVRDMHTSSGLLDRARRRPDSRGRRGAGARRTSASTSRSPARRPWPATRSAPTGRSWPATWPSSRAGCTTASSTSPRSRSSHASGIPRAYFAAPAKAGHHRALVDIQESIEELRYYREAVFVARPGPDTETAKTIAAEVAGSLTGTGRSEHPRACVRLTTPCRAHARHAWWV